MGYSRLSNNKNKMGIEGISRADLEWQKFQKDTSGNVAVNTISLGSLITEKFDYVSASYPDSVTEIYVYKNGGASGTLVATVTVIYVDSTKNQLVSVTKS